MHRIVYRGRSPTDRLRLADYPMAGGSGKSTTAGMGLSGIPLIRQPDTDPCQNANGGADGPAAVAAHRPGAGRGPRGGAVGGPDPLDGPEAGDDEVSVLGEDHAVVGSRIDAAGALPGDGPGVGAEGAFGVA